MTRQYDLIVFDWDGTLADSTRMIVDCMLQACDDAGIAPPGRDAASHIIGLGLAEAVDALFGTLDEQQYRQLVARYRHHYHTRDQDTPLFDGALETVQRLSQRGLLLAVATGKGRRGLDESLARSGLAPYMHATRCVDECFSKPHPQMLLELMDELDAPPGRTLMVGDTSHDLQMAANAGVASLAVSYGAQPAQTLRQYHPLACLDRFEQLGQWLDAHV